MFGIGINWGSDFHRLKHPYYVLNLLMCVSFVGCKLIPPLCKFVFDGNSEFEARQVEVLFFLALFVMVRSRRYGLSTAMSYLNNVIVCSRWANLVLWFMAYQLYGVIYVIVIGAQTLLLPQPVYRGPSHVLYFRDAKIFEEEITKRDVYWIVEFYTNWNVACIEFAPVFSDLSATYDHSHLKFGKVDLSRIPELAQRFNIKDSAFSRQLPTIILFKNGKGECYVPIVDASGKLQKFGYTRDNVINAFDLNNLYEECKKLAARKTKSD